MRAQAPLDSLRRWLKPPAFPDDLKKTRQASLVNMIALTCVVFIIVVMVGALKDHTVPYTTIIIDLIALAVIGIFLHWLRNGRVLAARIGLVGFGFIYVVGATASIGTIRTPTAAIFVFWVLMTGLLFGRRGILLGTTAASMAVAWLIFAQNAGWLHTATYQVGITQWITFTALFGFTSGLTNHIVQGIESSLALAEREIEQRKKTEASLTESELRYRTLVEWMPEPHAVHRDGLFLFANPAALKLFGSEDLNSLLGTRILDRVHPDDRELARTRTSDIAQTGRSHTPVVQRLLRLDGTVMDVEVQSTQILYGDAPAWLTSLHNITERKAIEEKLEEARHRAESASQAKSRFLASASHDLRQPAHALGMFVARLSHLPNDEQTRHLVDCMDASVRAMQDMLDGLFDLSTLDTEQTQIQRLQFPVEGILEQLRHNLSGSASAKGLRLRIRPCKAWVDSNPDLLYRILLNLANNAIRYTDHGSVMVACRPSRDGAHMRIEVRDSGIGIAPQFHEKVFQEFFQVGNPQRDRSKGMGVGLSIVERATRLLNHPIALRSALGKGTRFTLTVPLAPMRERGNLAEVSGISPGQEFRGLRVLLVEDDEHGRVALSGLLESWGCKVHTAEDAQAALRLVGNGQVPDVVISDYRLGGGVNGIETVRQLGTLAGRRLAACLISGDTDASLQQDAKADGLILLQKPVRPAKLRNLMRHLVDQKVS